MVDTDRKVKPGQIWKHFKTGKKVRILAVSQDTESWELAGAKMVQVDGEKIKADTYYRCVDGEVVEVEE